MQTLDGDQLWRGVPPEEKLELLSRAHSAGVFSAVCVILTCSAIAVGLQLPWLLWGSLLVSPLIFQLVAGRAWRNLRPRVMLEYLAARSAVRRFAFAARAKELVPKMLFRGTVAEVFSADEAQEELEAAITKTKEAEVWVALFNDAIVMIEERPGGATANFAQVLNEGFKIAGQSPDGKEYSSEREVILSYTHKLLGSRTVKLTSRYPAALVAFEKLATQRLEECKAKAKLLSAVLEVSATASADAGEY